MKKMITLMGMVLMLCWSGSSWAFACRTAAGAKIPIGGGRANVYVNLAPAVSPGENLVVDLSSQIFCHNDFPNTMTDYVTLQTGSAYGGVLQSFSGSVRFNGSSYPFPTRVETPRMIYDSTVDKPWPTALYLTPISTAGGVAIKSGQLIAILILHQTNSLNADSFQFIWQIYANNEVVVPTGGCDVSARNLNMTLPDYPGTMAIPLTVYCVKPQALAFYVSGMTTGTDRTIFTNTSSSTTAAQGIGLQMMRNGRAVSTNDTLPLGMVGSSDVSLGLSARYARTTGTVTAGSVQSVVGVTFVYP